MTSRPARLLLALASGFALAAAYPKFNHPIVAWVALAPLVIACLGASTADAALSGVLHSAAFFPVTLVWIDQVMRQYGDLSLPDAAGVLGLLTAAEAVFLAAFCMGVAYASRSSKARACLLAPFLWVATEFARAHLPYIAFPWNLAGYSISCYLGVLQIASVTGIYGLSFIVVGFNSLLAWGVTAKTRPAWIATACAAAALLLTATLVPRFLPADSPRRVAHLIQTDFPQSEHYPAEWMQMHAPELDQLEQMSIEAAKQEPGLIVWPEVPAPFTFQDPQFAARARRIAEQSGQDLLIGIVDWKLSPANEWQAFNSSVLLNPQGERTFSYDKVHLVPFGEYVPLRQYLTFAKRLTADISDFTPGKGYPVGMLPGGKFGVFICFESIFPGEVREFTRNGAQLLINVSNDGWFGRSAAPAQHLMMVRVRAVENRRWLLRATNNGFTVSIDPYGRYAARLAPDIRGELDAPYDFRSDESLYVMFGDWVAWVSVLASALLLAAGAAKQRA
jgi:apolipoprotein N-acyltransferase